jgi:hypothetical protein
LSAVRTRVPCAMTRFQRPVRPLRWVAASLVLVALVAAGCGGSSPGGRRTADSTTTTTLNPTAAAVLAAYRAGWAAFEHAGLTSNIFDPMLTATMVDPLLQQVRRNLAGDQVNGIVARGTFVLHPHLQTLTSTTATVVDCAYSTSILVYAKTGKPVPPITKPEYDGVQSTLVLVGSAWKVSQQSLTEGHCAPGY